MLSCQHKLTLTKIKLSYYDVLFYSFRIRWWHNLMNQQKENIIKTLSSINQKYNPVI